MIPTRGLVVLDDRTLIVQPTCNYREGTSAPAAPSSGSSRGAVPSSSSLLSLFPIMSAMASAMCRSAVWTTTSDLASDAFEDLFPPPQTANPSVLLLILHTAAEMKVATPIRWIDP